MLPEELLQHISNGDTNALGQLYELFKDKVYNTCLAYLQQQQEAEEATQDVFVEIFRSAQSFQSRSGASTWIYRICVNKCLDRIRSSKRQKRFAFITGLFNRDTGEIMYDVPSFHHPGIQLEQKENAARLFKSIRQLPDNQQSAFILKHMEGLSQKEIAQIMDIGEKAVESLLQRAKTNLKKLLDGNEGF